jgi:hypothetical protein
MNDIAMVMFMTSPNGEVSLVSCSAQLHSLAFEGATSGTDISIAAGKVKAIVVHAQFVATDLNLEPLVMRRAKPRMSGIDRHGFAAPMGLDSPVKWRP